MLTIVNFIGITESVVINMVMAFVEIARPGDRDGHRRSGTSPQGNADFGVLGDFRTEGNPALAILAGVALSFFAMTGFENTANVAEETIDPHKSFPRSLIGGMITAGVIYVLVSMAAALTVDTAAAGRSPTRRCSRSSKSGILPFSDDFMSTLFAVIAMIAITNTTLVAVVTQPRILYGMANEDVVPGVFAKIHSQPPQPLGRPALQRRRRRRACW